ncbi:MAG: hypothetical protein WBA45_06715 [Microthrixaceae bacterium]
MRTGPRSWVRNSAVAGLVVALVTVSLGAGWYMADRSAQTPDRVAANASPPQEIPVTVEVEERILSESVVLRGSVVAADPTQVMLAIPEGVAPIVTATPVPAGSTVEEGDVILGVAGRPVFVVAGPFPLFRDLVPGDEGVDVKMVQESLLRLGYRIPKDELGRFGNQTGSAVAKIWNYSGYPPAVNNVIDTSSDQGRVAGDGSAGEQGASAAGGGSADTSDGNSISGAATTRSDVVIRRSEVAVVPTLPATVVGLNAQVGSLVTADQPVISVTSAGLVLSVQLQSSQANSVKEGMTGEVDDPTLDLHIPVVVVQVKDGAGGADNGGQGGDTGLVALLRPTVKPFDQGILGSDLRVRIKTIASADAKLAVPVAAVRSRADGSQYVIRLDKNADSERDSTTSRRRNVTVDTGLSAGGWVAIEPSSADTLGKGDRVIVG